MNKGRIAIFFISFFLLTGFIVLHSNPPGMPDSHKTPGVEKFQAHHTSTWTIMVYLNGDNDSESAGIEEFLKIAQIGAPPQVHVLAQLDRSSRFDTRYDDWAGSRRFYLNPAITPSKNNTLMDLGAVNSGDPATLFDFIHWSKINYPAEHYALLLWNRKPLNGDLNGILKQDRILTDQTGGNDSLFLNEVKEVLGISGGIDVLGFDHSDLDHLFQQLDHTLVGTDYYTESILADFFFNEGAGQDISADDSYVTHALPFDFPFFEEFIAEDTLIYISTNGYIDFSSNSSHTDPYNSTSGLTGNKRIAPCWADLKTDGTAQQSEDIYIKENPDNLVIRWVAETYGDLKTVNVEAVLFKDGRIQFNYGNGNEDITPSDTPPTVGISKGDSSNYLLSEYNGDSSLTYAGSDLYTPFPSITLTSPNGQEEWGAGTVQEITWKTIGAVGEVKLEYSVNNGETYETITSSTVNNGIFLWLIPEESSQSCRVRVAQRDSDGSAYDLSDDSFTMLAAREPGITILNPHSGQTLIAGRHVKVAWSCVGTVGNVAIDYSLTNGETWVGIVESMDNTGLYLWQLPTTTSNECKIRVREIDNSPLAVSNGVFAIQAAPSLTVTAPNGGESWPVRSTKQITWSSTGIQDVKIEYSVNNGETWIYIAKVPNQGTYNWLIPDDISSSCRVRVRGEDNDESSWDISDQSFSIVSNTAPYIHVLSPNGGEQITSGSQYPIEWETSEYVGNVRIDYTSNNGESWNMIVESTDNQGSYTWQVPTQTSINYKIKVSEVNNELQDISDGVFQVLPQSSVTVTAPNGYESWASGSVQQITWTWAGIAGQVSLQYSTTNGEAWDTIVSSVPNTGSFYWEVPGTASTTCLIKIIAFDTDGTPFDISNTTFTITNQ